MFRHYCAIALFLPSLNGCGQVEDRLEALPDAEADLHEAPHANGTCNARDRLGSWVWAPPEAGVTMFRARENLRLALDPCGNVVVAASSYFNLWPRMGIARFFRDGLLDEAFKVSNDESAEQIDLEVDKYGNILLLSESWLQVLTAAGASHPGVPEAGLGLWGHGIAPGPDDTWYIDGYVHRLVALPSGSALWETTPGPQVAPYQRVSVVSLGSDEVLKAYVYEKFSAYAGDSAYSSLAVYQSSLVDPSISDLKYQLSHSEDDPTFYVDTALLAVGKEGTYLGTTAYTADPITHARLECREPMLVNIEDSDWKPDAFGFCGALEALAVADDGSIVSLWTVPVEPLDKDVHPFEAEPTLVRHSADGKETGRWVLTDVVGRTAQDGTGAMDMALDEGGKAAIVGALIGGPWNGRFFESPSKTVVAKVRLD